MVIDFNGNAGNYGIRVTNPGGAQSNTFNFTVQPPTTPVINSINPPSPIATVGNQNVTVNGSNFVSGLTVTVFFPGGGSGTLSGSQIQSVTSSSFVMVIDFNGNAGNYGIRVTNPGGAQSNTFNFTVQPQTTPVINSINPPSPVATVGNQNMTVNGSNFVSGLTVTVFFPGGGTGTLSGSQIQNVTSSSFVMVIDFNGNAGNYGIRVTNPGGAQSNTFNFTVQPPTTPVINSINPPSPIATVGNQNVTVNGSNFVSGLTVTVFFPGGGSGTLSGAQIQSVTSSSFVMVIDFNGNIGNYGIRVNNPDSRQSAPFAFTVQQVRDAATLAGETIRDGTQMQPGQSFTKTWTLRNVGTTTWDSRYKLQWTGGDTLSNHAETSVNGSVAPGGPYTFSIPMTAPSANGSYREVWKFVNANGETIKVDNSTTVWASITVGSSCTPPVITTQPRGGTLASGTPITLRVASSGQQLQYQWFQGTKGDTSHRITGATSSLYTISGLASTTSFWVRVTTKCGASVDSETATVIIGQAIDIIDPVCSETDCQGAYLQSSGGGLTQNADQLAAASVRRSGIVADGVTKLLLRVRADSTVQFSLSSGVGTLTQKDGSGFATSISVVPVSTSHNEKYAFAIYQAPSDFVGSAKTLDITIIAKVGSTDIPGKITLKRPPVLLVHGLHGSTDGWENLASRLRQNNFDVCDGCIVDYSRNSDQTFNPNKTSPPIDALQGALRSVRDSYRHDGVAITQVDVVGHSMGGLVTRGDAARSDFRRRDNYSRGDIRKLITIGTPHFGSPLAAYLVDHKVYKSIAELLNYMGPAIYDLVPSSEALNALNGSDLQTHAIVGIAPANSHFEQKINKILFFTDVGTIQQDLHDVVVPVTSQIGGLPGTARSLVSGVVHSDYTGEDVGELESSAVFADVISTLNAPLDSNQFNLLSSPVHPETLHISPTNRELITPTPAPSVSPSVALSDGSSLTPAEGTKGHTGETMTIRFSIPDATGIAGAIFFVGDRILSQEAGDSFSISFTIPSSKAGRLNITAVTYGAGSVQYSASTYLVVEASTPPALVRVSPVEISLGRVGQVFQLQVVGQLADGTQIDLTDGAAGTSYSLENAIDRVVSVSPDGAIEARGIGEATILVTYSGATYTVKVTVVDSAKPRITTASIIGKKLILTGEQFDDGAKILMDGDQQKSANDDQNPATTLIGKKAGRFIAPGQTVVLMVRNSDGSLSNGFSFTRPQ
jgi:pimeloyl-ACP methyl ester carboxylesterase